MSIREDYGVVVLGFCRTITLLPFTHPWVNFVIKKGTDSCDVYKLNLTQTKEKLKEYHRKGYRFEVRR